jgi:hypothetical protein
VEGVIKVELSLEFEGELEGELEGRGGEWSIFTFKAGGQVKGKRLSRRIQGDEKKFKKWQKMPKKLMALA